MAERTDRRPLKIAVAASGLAHIRRGVEAWAHDLGKALRRQGVDATTFQGTADPSGDSGEVIGCITRSDPRAKQIVEGLKGMGGWRLGLGSGYAVEQTTFAFNLYRRIRSSYDILHVQDPQVALLMEAMYRRRLLRPRVIFGHGTEEDAAMLRRFRFLQHLAPNYAEDWRAQQPDGQLNFVIPNFVDTELFRPGDKATMRRALGLPADALIVLSVGALNCYHKRMDYVIEEFARWKQTHAGKAMLVLAGACEGETERVRSIAAQLPSAEVRIIENASRSGVLELMQAADFFTLASKHEMLGIAVLEALATGLPVACNDTPTLSWVVGQAGRLTTILEPGALAAQFEALAEPGTRARLAGNAREQAERVFSEHVVVEQIRQMYMQVAEA